MLQLIHENLVAIEDALGFDQRLEVIGLGHLIPQLRYRGFDQAVLSAGLRVAFASRLDLRACETSTPDYPRLRPTLKTITRFPSYSRSSLDLVMLMGSLVTSRIAVCNASGVGPRAPWIHIPKLSVPVVYGSFSGKHHAAARKLSAKSSASATQSRTLGRTSHTGLFPIFRKLLTNSVFCRTVSRGHSNLFRSSASARNAPSSLRTSSGEAFSAISRCSSQARKAAKNRRQTPNAE